MPATDRTITMQDAIEHVRAHAFTTRGGAAGAEVEWLVVNPADRLIRPPLDTVATLASAATRTRVTFEPGGQLELSSEPGRLAEICDAIAADEAAVTAALRGAGLDLLGMGLDPVRRDRRLVFGPRYDAMERYFDAGGPEGRRMMCGTASIQVNVDAGGPGGVDARWTRAHTIGPVLAAAFANSPFALGRPSGWRSTRLANWWQMDASRTHPAEAGGDADAAWARYALRAKVMMLRDGAGFVPAESAVSFGSWIERGYAGLYPSLDDLDYHLTTLFPPVRARGWLELRFLDAQQAPWWRAAIAVTVALMDDDAAADRAMRACGPLAGHWMQAARDGVSGPVFRAAAIECFAAAFDALPRLDADDETIDAVERFAATFTACGRCPADALLAQPAPPVLVSR